MNALRRTLYVQAAVWAVAGLGLAVVPHLILFSIFGGRVPPGTGVPAGLACKVPGSAFKGIPWERLLGLQTFGLAMYMVLVAHRIERLWWWAWGFALVTLATAAVVTLHAGIGRTACESAAWWWLFAALTVGLAASMLYGLFVASREQPDLIVSPD